MIGFLNLDKPKKYQTELNKFLYVQNISYILSSQITKLLTLGLEVDSFGNSYKWHSDQTLLLLKLNWFPVLPRMLLFLFSAWWAKERIFPWLICTRVLMSLTFQVVWKRPSSHFIHVNLIMVSASVGCNWSAYALIFWWCWFPLFRWLFSFSILSPFCVLIEPWSISHFSVQLYKFACFIN